MRIERIRLVPGAISCSILTNVINTEGSCREETVAELVVLGIAIAQGPGP